MLLVWLFKLWMYFIRRLIDHRQNEAKSGSLEKCEHQWGSYRGNLYFGMRTRQPRSLLTGLLWYSISNSGEPIGNIKSCVKVAY